MLDYSKFDYTPFLPEILESMVFSEDAEVLRFLQKYKYATEAEIVDFLNEELNTEVFQKLTEVKRNSKYRTVESKYDVIINEYETNYLIAYYDHFNNNKIDVIDLDPVFNGKQIHCVALTPYSFDNLCNRAGMAFAPLPVFKRYLVEAIKRNATDMHFDVKHYQDCVRYPVSFRIGGVLKEIDLLPMTYELNKRIISSLIAKNTTANELDLMETSGVVASSSGILGEDIELRISANSVKDGYHYVVRIQQRNTFDMPIEKLGFDVRVLDLLHKISKKRSGVTLITGAIRTGKNTTAFAMANEMVNENIKIVSYESPIEVLMPFTQIDYQESEEVLLNAIRLAKKQDVNVAFINEIPNKEVAFAVQNLVNSSIHVITTMHMNRVWHLPYRLKEYYGDSYKDVLSQINVVINQKMFPKTCPICRDKIMVDSVKSENVRKFLRKHNIDYVYDNHGCDNCEGTGYLMSSNQPYAEFVVFTDELVTKLLNCDKPSDMELILREYVQETSLESFMLEGVISGDLHYNALEVIC